MSFLYPLGLLGLIGVPILIIIYIIKNKYTEQTVASTYIWTLSERFLKNKNPINRLYNILSLILQILAVVCISVAIAHPVFAIPGQANDYLFILDASGSMLYESSGVTRFERGKDEIEDIILQSGNGSTYTLIRVGETTDVVYKNLDDSERAIKLLKEAECSEVASNVSSALESAQKYFGEASAAKVYLVTDRSYETVTNAELLNVSANETNRAVLTADAAFTSNGLTVSGMVISYGEDAEITVSVYVNDEEVSAGSVSVNVKGVKNPLSLSGSEDETQKEALSLATEYTVVCEGVTQYASLKVTLNGGDAFADDDTLVLYNIKQDSSFTTLIVGESNFFVSSFMGAMGYSADEVNSDEYEKKATTYDYGLYIFNEYTPKAMPRSGAVWFISPSNISDSGFVYNGEAEDSKYVSSYKTSSSTVVKKLLSGVDTDTGLYLSKYSKYRLESNFTSLLSCEGNPVLFAGSNAYGNREVVFGFSLNDSDVVLTYNWMQLLDNLLGYTFPTIIDKADYFCGDTAEINVLSNCNSICVKSPSGKEEYLSTATSTVGYKLSETGLYSVTVKVGSGDATSSKRVVYIYAQSPYSEGVPDATDDVFTIMGENVDSRDGIYENLFVIFIILATFFVADWMVYCYEQYQLR